MIIKIISLITILGYSYATTDLPEGMHPFGIAKTVLACVDREMNLFENSPDAERFKSKYGSIALFLRKNRDSQNLEKTAELLNLIHTARRSVSDNGGNSLEWECGKHICNGHTFSKMYASYDAAQNSKPKWYEEYKNKEGINPHSVTLYDIKEHGSKGKFARCVLTTATLLGGAAVVIRFGLTDLCSSGIDSCISVALVVSAFYTASGAKKEYGRIRYEVTLCYNHEETSLSNCYNNGYQPHTKSTSSLLDALNVLYSSVQHFQLEQKIKNQMEE